MHRRVRWENVIRAAGVSLLVAVVVAWPRLAPPEPAMPGAEPAPLVAAEPSPAVPAGAPAQRRAGPMRAHDGVRPGARSRGRARPHGRTRPSRERAARRRGSVTRRRGSGSRAERPVPETRPGTSGGETGGGGTTRPGGETGGGRSGPGGDALGEGPAGGDGTIAPDPAQTEFGFEAG
jgi:hypothetical protein